jgi:hypothetical protein
VNPHPVPCGEIAIVSALTVTGARWVVRPTVKRQLGDAGLGRTSGITLAIRVGAFGGARRRRAVLAPSPEMLSPDFLKNGYS